MKVHKISRDCRTEDSQKKPLSGLLLLLLLLLVPLLLRLSISLRLLVVVVAVAVAVVVVVVRIRAFFDCPQCDRAVVVVVVVVPDILAYEFQNNIWSLCALYGVAN